MILDIYYGNCYQRHNIIPLIFPFFFFFFFFPPTYKDVISLYLLHRITMHNDNICMQQYAE